jgi:hypothetical protein
MFASGAGRAFSLFLHISLQLQKAFVNSTVTQEFLK